MAYYTAYYTALTSVAGQSASVATDSGVPWAINGTQHIRCSAISGDAGTRQHTFTIDKGATELIFSIEIGKDVLSDVWDDYNDQQLIIPFTVITANADVSISTAYLYVFDAAGNYIASHAQYNPSVSLGAAGANSFSLLFTTPYYPPSRDYMMYIAVAAYNAAAHSTSDVVLEFSASSSFVTPIRTLPPVSLNNTLSVTANVSVIPAGYDIIDAFDGPQLGEFLNGHTGELNIEWSDNGGAYYVHSGYVQGSGAPGGVDFTSEAYNQMYSSALDSFEYGMTLAYNGRGGTTARTELVLFRGQLDISGEILALVRYAYVEFAYNGVDWIISLKYWTESTGSTVLDSAVNTMANSNDWSQYFLSIIGAPSGGVSVNYNGITLSGNVPTATIPAEAGMVGLGIWTEDGRSLYTSHDILSPYFVRPYTVSQDTIPPTFLSFTSSLSGTLNNYAVTHQAVTALANAVDMTSVAVIEKNTVAQLAYRWRYNDGDEDVATWIAAANTSIGINDVDDYRLRLGLDNTENAPNTNQTYELQVNVDNGGWQLASNWLEFPYATYWDSYDATNAINKSGAAAWYILNDGATVVVLHNPGNTTTCEVFTGRDLSTSVTNTIYDIDPNARWPSLAMVELSDGTLVVAGHRSDFNDSYLFDDQTYYYNHIYVSISSDVGQTWSTPSRVDPAAYDGEDSNFQDLCVTDDDILHVAYNTGAATTMHQQSSNSGSSWSGAESSGLPYFNIASGALVPDGNNFLHIVFLTTSSYWWVAYYTAGVGYGATQSQFVSNSYIKYTPFRQNSGGIVLLTSEDGAESTTFSKTVWSGGTLQPTEDCGVIYTGEFENWQSQTTGGDLAPVLGTDKALIPLDNGVSTDLRVLVFDGTNVQFSPRYLTAVDSTYEDMRAIRVANDGWGFAVVQSSSFTDYLRESANMGYVDIIDGQSVAQRVTAGAFLLGNMGMSSDGETHPVTLPGDTSTEVEFVFGFPAVLGTNEPVDFRVVSADTPYIYTVIPRVYRDAYSARLSAAFDITASLSFAIVTVRSAIAFSASTNLTALVIGPKYVLAGLGVSIDATTTLSYSNNPVETALSTEAILTGKLVVPQTEQIVYRLRDTDGDEVTATWLAPTDTDTYLPVSDKARVRFGVSSIIALNNKVLQGEYSVDNGPWQELTEESAKVSTRHSEVDAHTGLLSSNIEVVATYLCANGNMLVAYYNKGGAPEESYIAVSTDGGQIFTATLITMPDGHYNNSDWVRFDVGSFNEFTNDSHIAFCVILENYNQVDSYSYGLYVWWSVDSGVTWSASGTEAKAWFVFNDTVPVWVTNGVDVYIMLNWRVLGNYYQPLLVFYDGLGSWDDVTLSTTASTSEHGMHGRFPEVGESFDFLVYQREPFDSSECLIVGFEVTNMSVTSEYYVTYNSFQHKTYYGGSNSIKVVKKDGTNYIACSERNSRINSRTIRLLEMASASNIALNSTFRLEQQTPEADGVLDVAVRDDGCFKFATTGGWVVYNKDKDTWFVDNYALRTSDSALYQAILNSGDNVVMYEDAGEWVIYRYYADSGLVEGADTTQQLTSGVFVTDNNGQANDGHFGPIPSFPSGEEVEIETAFRVDRDLLDGSELIRIRSGSDTYINNGQHASLTLPWLAASLSINTTVSPELLNPQLRTLQSALISRWYVWGIPTSEVLLAELDTATQLTGALIYGPGLLSAALSANWACSPQITGFLPLTAQLAAAYTVTEVTTIEVWLSAALTATGDAQPALSRVRGVWASMAAVSEITPHLVATRVLAGLQTGEMTLEPVASFLQHVAVALEGQGSVSGAVVAQRSLRAEMALSGVLSASAEAGRAPEIELQARAQMSVAASVVRGIRTSVSFSGTLVAVDSSARLVSTRLRGVMYLTPQLSAGEYCLRVVQSLHKVTVSRAPLVQSQRLNTVVSHPRKVIEVKAVQEIETVVGERAGE